MVGQINLYASLTLYLLLRLTGFYSTPPKKKNTTDKGGSQLFTCMLVHHLFYKCIYSF